MGLKVTASDMSADKLLCALICRQLFPILQCLSNTTN